MTTEDDFRRAIDAHKNDWQTVAVFSDWLRDHDDPRADGYQALSVQRLRPIPDSTVGWIFGRDDNDQYNTKAKSVPGLLPPDWYEQLNGLAESCGLETHGGWWTSGTFHDLFDAAALAFAKLPAKRRTELLAGKAEEKT